MHQFLKTYLLDNLPLALDLDLIHSPHPGQPMVLEGARVGGNRFVLVINGEADGPRLDHHGFSHQPGGNGAVVAIKADGKIRVDLGRGRVMTIGEKGIHLEPDLRMGDAEFTACTCDLSYDYVKENASYRT